MNTSQTSGEPRSNFDIRKDDRDYSGMTIADTLLEKADIEKSFFHGTVLRNCDFIDVKLNNTEFSESSASRAHFVNTDLTGSDFVDCRFEDGHFEQCSFEKGEWRESVFVNCNFIGCDFTHTTIALCKFIACEFDAKTIGKLENRSIYSNVFQRCRFMAPLVDSAFCSRNFGVPASGQSGALMHAGAGVTIEQICLLNNLGRLRTIDIIQVTENICDMLTKGGQRRNGTLRFLSNIVRMLTEERRISATSLMYLERIVMALANTTEDHDVFKVVMDAIVEIRNALVLIASETEESAVKDADGTASAVYLYFSETFGRPQIELLKDALATTAGVQPSDLTISEIRHGSTFIELAVTNMVAIAGLLTALNYVLRQAKITVKTLGELGAEIRELTAAAKPKRAARSVTKKKPAKAIAVLSTGAVADTLRPLQASVQEHGRVLVEMDEPADVTILTK
jgi:hypothetical protein